MQQFWPKYNALKAHFSGEAKKLGFTTRAPAASATTLNPTWCRYVYTWCLVPGIGIYQVPGNIVAYAQQRRQETGQV